MRLVRAVLVFTSVIVWSATAAAQVGISIQGLVLDGTLSALPGATVTATNLATGIARQVVSGEDGRYELAALAPAEAYELRVTLPGFAETRLRLTSLAAGEQRVVDVRMAVAGVAEALDVRPDATLARTPTPALGGTLSARTGRQPAGQRPRSDQPGLSHPRRRAGARLLQPGAAAHHQRLLVARHQLHRSTASTTPTCSSADPRCRSRSARRRISACSSTATPASTAAPATACSP